MDVFALSGFGFTYLSQISEVFVKLALGWLTV